MYAIGQKFENSYPPEAAQWCNDNCAMMVPVGESFEIKKLPSPTLLDVQAAKRAEINAGFDAALTASLTMPSVNTPPSTVELTVAIGLFNAEDPTGLVDLCAIHEARRASLLAAVDAATSVEAVQAITVTYAV